MATLKSKMFYLLMRYRHLFKGKLRKEVFDSNTSILGFREECERTAAKLAKLPDGVRVEPDNLGGIRAERLIPEGADPEKIIMYVHGGGYVSGSCDDHRAIVAKFAKVCGFTNLTYDYRLAPEHPFPAALDDSVKVYEILLQRGFKPENIITAGESAGGGLVLALLLALKERKIALPSACVSISPWTDLTCSGESYKTKNKVSVAPLNSWWVFSKYYYADTRPDHPLVSPLFGDLKGLPPILINSGTYDELVDDGERFYRKAKEAGVDVTFRAGEGMVHCYPLLSPFFREAKEAMDEICEFVRRHMSRQ